MRVPTYWARQDFTTTASDGRCVTRTALGWSSVSQADAEQHAAERARRAAERDAAGRSEEYDYGHVPPREPVLGSIEHDGDTIGLITRNRYGSRVLNTDRVLFADLDLPWVEVREPGWIGAVQRFFGQRKFLLANDAETLARVADWHDRHPDTAMRVYRTSAGIRLLFTDGQYDPTEPAVTELLQSLGSDQLYVQLTRTQRAFRARLSPKPWRCGATRPPALTPINHPDWAEQIEAWAQTYESKAAGYATCRLVQCLGGPADDPVTDAIVATHDHYTLRDGAALA